MSFLTIALLNNSSAAHIPVLPPMREGQTFYLVGTGDSIAKDYPFLDDTLSYQRFASDTIGSPSYAAKGHPNYRTDEILALFTQDAIDTKPSITLIEGGVNDIAQGRSNSLTVADLKAMIDLAAVDSLVVYLPIFPWTNGTNTQNQQADTINSQMIAYMQTNYPTHIVADCRNFLGKFRAGGAAENHWDLKTEYDHDGVHLTQLGYMEVGVYIGQTILNHL